MSLVAEDLACSYGPTKALDGVGVKVSRGEILVVLGANGAGKSTLLKVLAGERRPERGTVTFDGLPVSGSDISWRKAIGLVSHKTGLYRHLSVRENLLFWAGLYEVPDRETRVLDSLNKLGAAHLSESSASSLSRGQAQRVALARTLLHGAEVLFLDEPFTGLDPEGAEALQRLLLGDLVKQRAVVMVTHDLHRGMACADRIQVLARGRTLWQGVRGGGTGGGPADDLSDDPFQVLPPELAAVARWATGAA